MIILFLIKSIIFLSVSDHCRLQASHTNLEVRNIYVLQQYFLTVLLNYFILNTILCHADLSRAIDLSVKEKIMIL